MGVGGGAHLFCGRPLAQVAEPCDSRPTHNKTCTQINWKWLLKFPRK